MSGREFKWKHDEHGESSIGPLKRQIFFPKGIWFQRRFTEQGQLGCHHSLPKQNESKCQRAGRSFCLSSPYIDKPRITHKSYTHITQAEKSMYISLDGSIPLFGSLAKRPSSMAGWLPPQWSPLSQAVWWWHSTSTSSSSSAASWRSEVHSHLVVCGW